MTSAPPSLTHLRVHTFAGLQPGPRVIFLGAVHGNETCGRTALLRIVSEFDSGVLELAAGSVSFVPCTNPLAFQRKQRNGERNLNRGLRPRENALDYEDRIGNQLCPLLASHDVLVDLHSFQSAGEPFALIGPRDNDGPIEPFSQAAREEALVLRLGPRRVVEGWLPTYTAGVQRRVERTPPAELAGLLNTDPGAGVGTTEYMRRSGGCAVTVECGHHSDPAAPDVAYRAVRNALAHLGLVADPAPAPRGDVEFLRLCEVTDRLHEGDAFARPWASYDPLQQGDLIGTRADGSPVRAPRDGFIVFPNPAAGPGNEWFFFAERSARPLRA